MKEIESDGGLILGKLVQKEICDCVKIEYRPI